MSAELANFVGLIDTRTLAFWCTVDKDGVADLHANGIAYSQAAEWLRHMADVIDEEEARCGCGE